ncbi:MAG: hypothetical protein V3R57_06860 [Candidatus Bathyarchaeia archaeon]
MDSWALLIDTFGGAGEARTRDLLTEKYAVLSVGHTEGEGGQVPGLDHLDYPL